MDGHKVPWSHATLNCTEDLLKVVIVIHRILSGVKFNNMRYGQDKRIKIRTFMSFIFIVFERKRMKNRTVKLQISNCTNLLCFILSIVLEDLLHPCEFFASHQYSPWWSAVTNSKVKVELPLASVIFAWGITSLYHVITGFGIPAALQVKFAFPPREINFLAGGLTVKIWDEFSRS